MERLAQNWANHLRDGPISIYAVNSSLKSPNDSPHTHSPFPKRSHQQMNTMKCGEFQRRNHLC